ncbi:putative RER1 protein [Cardiosporidium cionae]|uniref:RER1 protein n=1 Tax=Cardiosporidium cionae TaxID=476202 RepID=A0ABQ7J7D8_9APIC|nr:putative RER1 protein [Cardiosporidium cionae]|eukprot:KAF8819898.1 putative RER1 protein [Cardiosporidium cionae]
MMTSDDASRQSKLSISLFFRSLARLFSHNLDKSTVYVKTRWLVFLLLFVLLFYRIIDLGAFYIVAYGFGLYVLNLFLAFISPPLDPETDTYVLPVRDTEEFRPFIRRLPEFKFWLAASKAALCSIFITFCSFLDIPVYWPLLVLYFILLFVLTMKEQLRRMIKYRYVPFSWGKQSYGDIIRGQRDEKGHTAAPVVIQSGSASNIRTGEVKSVRSEPKYLHPTPMAAKFGSWNGNATTAMIK